jgi:hypothetical protein
LLEFKRAFVFESLMLGIAIDCNCSRAVVWISERSKHAGHIFAGFSYS